MGGVYGRPGQPAGRVQGWQTAYRRPVGAQPANGRRPPRSGEESGGLRCVGRGCYLASAFSSSASSSSDSRPGVGRLNLVIAKRKTT